jgi:hypothetical protein
VSEETTPGGAGQSGTHHVPGNSVEWRELIAVILLSVTAIATAWCGFQATKWGGAMSIAFSQATTARMEATRADGNANRQSNNQIQLYVDWLNATLEGNTELSDYLSENFPEPLAAAWAAWMRLDPFEGTDAPATPFDMPEFVQPDALAAREADARADALFQEALESNQRGDDYTLLTVVFATVLFFAAMSWRSSWLRPPSWCSTPS